MANANPNTERTLRDELQHLLDALISAENENCGCFDKGAFSEDIQRAKEALAWASDYDEAAADHYRLVRELDVLLNGKADAARQASLCDIVSQVRVEGIRSRKESKATTSPDAMFKEWCEQHDLTPSDCDASDWRIRQAYEGGMMAMCAKEDQRG